MNLILHDCMVPGNLNPVRTMACGGLALVFIVFGSEALVCFVISARLLGNLSPIHIHYSSGCSM